MASGNRLQVGRLGGERLDAALVPLAIGSVAVLARALEALRDPLVFDDGPRFIAVADAMLRGEWQSAFGDPFHPLTSAIMALVSLFTGFTLEASGELVCVLAGGLAAAALYVLLRRHLGASVATIAGVAFAVHPRLVQSSSGVQSDGLYLAATLIAILFAWRALDAGRTRAAAAAGFACGAAYLVRPEGLLVALVFGVWLAVDLCRRSRPLAPTLAHGAAFAAALALVAAPYVWALHEVTGVWTLSQKKSVAALVGWSAEPARTVLEPPPFQTVAAPTESPAHASEAGVAGAVAPPAGILARVALAFGELAHDFLRALTPTALALSLLGVRRGAPSRLAALLLSYVGALALLLFALHLSSGYVSRRHWLVAAALLLPFAARGLERVRDWALRALPQAARRSWLAPACGAALLLAFLLHSALPPAEADKRARQRAAEWLRASARPASVATLRARDAYYAGATRHVALVDLSAPEAIVAAARGGGARFLLVDEDLLVAASAAPLGAFEVHRVTYPGGAVGVFELR